MKVILDEKIYNEIWDKIYKGFKFTPSTDTSIKTFEFPMHYEQFNLKSFWNEDQEKIVNTMFKELSDDDIYALEWQSDCFEFNPNENIEYEYHYHDDERNVEVYFPTYYPNGDYYFFVAKDFSYGMFTHPWKKQIYIWGEKLINKINQNVAILNLEKINNNTSTPTLKTIKEIYNCKPDNVNEISPLSKWYNELIDKTIDEITENDVEIMIRQNILLELASIKQQYKIRFFFDYCSYTCLWSGDELTGKKYGYPITKFKELGLSNSTIKEIEKLSNLFDTSLNWADPGYGDSPWDKQQWKDFDEQAQRLFEKISKELPKNFKLVNEHKPYIK